MACAPWGRAWAPGFEELAASGKLPLTGDRVFHTLVDLGPLEMMIAQEYPSDEYYAMLPEWACSHPLDHLASLEQLLDICIVSGISLGGQEGPVGSGGAGVLPV